MSVAAAAVHVAVEYVRATFRADAQSIQLRAVRGIDRVPAGLIGS